VSHPDPQNTSILFLAKEYALVELNFFPASFSSLYAETSSSGKNSAEICVIKAGGFNRETDALLP
jgi:hypothetical protein